DGEGRRPLVDDVLELLLPAAAGGEVALVDPHLEAGALEALGQRQRRRAVDAGVREEEELVGHHDPRREDCSGFRAARERAIGFAMARSTGPATTSGQR